MRFTLSRWESARGDIVLMHALSFASILLDVWIKRRANLEHNILLFWLKRDCSSKFESTSSYSRAKCPT